MEFEKFLSELGSGTPSPGGGSASAMVGSISAALSRMVANLTIGKKGYEDQEALMNYIAGELQKIETRFIELSLEDEEAFNRISATWKMPRNTDEEKKERSRKIREATLEALKPPWNIASSALRVLDASAKLAETGNKNAISDAVCSAEFAIATVRSALHNIVINLSGIRDQGIVESETLKMRMITEKAEVTYRQVIETFHKRL